jgi:hypothetical protein
MKNSDSDSRNTEMQTKYPEFRTSISNERQNRKIRNWAEFVIFLTFVAAIVTIAVKIFG